MPRKNKKYHFIYKTTNVVNEKFYVGMHSTDDLNDGYIGSGKKLWYSIKKYGREKFTIERLEFFEKRKDLIKREKKLVNDKLLKEPLCMNLRPGGEGGFISVENQFKRAQAGGLKAWKTPGFREKMIEISKKTGKLAYLKKIGIFNPALENGFKGKKHTIEFKNKIGEINSKHQTGKGNSQYGTCWITKNKKNKKIKKEELQRWLDNGWNKGAYYSSPSIKKISDEQIINAIKTNKSMNKAAKSVNLGRGVFKRRALELGFYKTEILNKSTRYSYGKQI